MTIAEVSKKYDITADTLRYYERIGLIPAVPRKPNGIRDYDQASCQWVELMKCMISMATLMLKGAFAVLASYLLILTTSMESICYALRLLHVPKIMVTMVLLIYRYVIVLLKEAERISQAYSMRAPDQKGIHYRAWGTLLGQLMLRSIDRAQTVYESMLLRGFDGSFRLSKKQKMDRRSAVYLAGWLGIVVLLRYVSVFKLAGSLLE